MKCTSQIQASRVAAAGAKKMSWETHRIEASAFKALYGKQFVVENKANGETYFTGIEEGHIFCTCPFFHENREFCTCKHIEACRAEVAEWNRYDQEASEEAEYRAEVAEVMERR